MSGQQPILNPAPNPLAGPGNSTGTISRPRVELLAAVALSFWILFLHGLFLCHAGPLWRDEIGTIDFAAMPALSDIRHNLQYRQFSAALRGRGPVVDPGRVDR